MELRRPPRRSSFSAIPRASMHDPQTPTRAAVADHSVEHRLDVVVARRHLLAGLGRRHGVADQEDPDLSLRLVDARACEPQAVVGPLGAVRGIVEHEEQLQDFTSRACQSRRGRRLPRPAAPTHATPGIPRRAVGPAVHADEAASPRRTTSRSTARGSRRRSPSAPAARAAACGSSSSGTESAPGMCPAWNSTRGRTSSRTTEPARSRRWSSSRSTGSSPSRLGACTSAPASPGHRDAARRSPAAAASARGPRWPRAGTPRRGPACSPRRGRPAGGPAGASRCSRPRGPLSRARSLDRTRSLGQDLEDLQPARAVGRLGDARHQLVDLLLEAPRHGAIQLLN